MTDTITTTTIDVSLSKLTPSPANVRIPTESGQQFQLKAAIDSNGRRPLIPIEPGHP